jgi:hypothetical protein
MYPYLAAISDTNMRRRRILAFFQIPMMLTMSIRHSHGLIITANGAPGSNAHTTRNAHQTAMHGITFAQAYFCFRPVQMTNLDRMGHVRTVRLKKR